MWLCDLVYYMLAILHTSIMLVVCIYAPGPLAYCIELVYYMLAILHTSIMLVVCIYAPGPLAYCIE